MIKGMIVAVLLFCGFVVQAQTSSNPVGKWDYTIPEAPYEYSKGKAEFKMQDNKLMMTLILDQNTGTPFEVTKKDNSYICRMSFEGFIMTFTLNPDGDNLKGIISSDQWDVSITMTPEKK
jgi:hypothetical protein